MKREVAIVVGKTGFGKSLWGQLYARLWPRRLIYDPTSTYRAEYLPPEEIIDRVANKETKSFAFAVSDPEYVPALGLLAYGRGDNLLVLEEASTFFPKGQSRLDEWARQLVFMGRHQRCSLLFVAQRATSIPIDVRSQANRIVSFQQHEPDDVRTLSEFFGKERAELIPNLPKLECFDFHNGDTMRYSIRRSVEHDLGIRLDIEPESVYTFIRS